MEEEVVPPSSLALSLRQLMCLDCPRVLLDKDNKFALSSSSASSRPPPRTQTNNTDIYTVTGRTNAVCSICTHTPSIISNDKKNNVIISLSPDHRRHAHFLGLLMSSRDDDKNEEDDEGNKTFCSVCLTTVTRLLRLREEMEEIQTRILTVFELRLKLKKAAKVETPDEEPGVSNDHVLEEYLDSDPQVIDTENITEGHMMTSEEDQRSSSFPVVGGVDIDEDGMDLDPTDDGIDSSDDHQVQPRLVLNEEELLASNDATVIVEYSASGQDSQIIVTRRSIRRKKSNLQMKNYLIFNDYDGALPPDSPPRVRVGDNSVATIHKPIRIRRGNYNYLRTRRECSICNTTFNHQVNFEAHTHPDPTNLSIVVYTCKVCGKGFKTMTAWKRHLKERHNPNTNVAQCLHCSKVFPTRSSLQKHTQICSQPQEDPRKCTFASCGKSFSTPEDRVEHEAATHVTYFKRKCYFCGQGFHCIWRLERHMRTHTLEHALPEQNECDDLRYSCPKCGMPFDGLSSMKKHMSLVHRKLPPKKKKVCPICNKGFLSEEFFKAHTHPDPTDPRNIVITCQVCGKTLKSIESLKQHRRLVHLKIKDAPRQCEHCGKVFLYKRTLKKHSRVCSIPAEEQTKCTYASCGRTFPTRGDRDDHERVVHKGLLSNKCYFCGTVFNYTHKIERHIRLHTLETPSSCDKCGKEFTDDRYLKSHLIYSACGTDEKLKELGKRKQSEYRKRWSAKQSYVCDQCGKRFSEKKGLTTHKQRRHGCQGNAEVAEKAKPIIKPIQQRMTRLFCPICNSSFLTTEYFQAHTHPDPTNPENVCYTCQRCDKVCTTKETFKFHLFRHKKKVKLDQREVPPVKKKKVNPSPPGNKEMCLMCNKFLSPEDLKAHTHPDPTDLSIVVYICQVCGKALKDKGSYRQHLHVHEKVGQELQCHHCGRVLLGHIALKFHVKGCSIPPEDRGRCRFADCGKMFPSRAERIDHERVVHKGLDSNTCYFCGKIFNCLSKVERHLRIHTMETPFSCDKCGKDFPDERYLTSHIRSVCTSDENARQEYVERKREYERQYRARPRLQCDQCDKRFGDKKLLASHIRREH